ncbi:MAG: hypothetical protein ABI134_23510, partial [Byssovorax sp.]
MSARLPLFFVAVSSVLSMGCGASGRAEVSITDLVMKVESNGAIKAGSFDLHIARPASGSGSSGIRLHQLEILREGADGGGVSVARILTHAPGDLEPGAEIVSTVGFALSKETSVKDSTFDSCAQPEGFFANATYFDEAEDAFFTVRSPPSWVSPKRLTGTTWAETFGDAALQIAFDIAAFSDGSSVLVGSTSDASVPEGTPPEVPAWAPFVMKLDAAGKTVWDRRLALSPSPLLLASNQGPSLVAASPNGGIVVAGVLDGTLDLGDGHVITSVGDTDVFLARFDATGKAIEARRFGDGLAQTVSTMDVDAAGNVVLVGALAGAMDFGAGTVAPIIDPTVTSYYVARLPEAGAPIYAKVPLALAGPMHFAAAVGAEGTVVLGGTFTSNAWIGAEPPHPTMSEAGFLLTLAPDGSVAWSAVIDGAAVTQVALDQGDVVAVVTVGINAQAIVGGKEISGGLDGEVVLARFDPAGALRYAIPLGGKGFLDVTSFVLDSAGHSLLSGKLFRA